MTATAALSGGDFPCDGARALASRLRGDCPFQVERRALRLVWPYDTESWKIWARAAPPTISGETSAGDLTEAEVVMDREFA